MMMVRAAWGKEKESLCIEGLFVSMSQPQAKS
jgi:hypothetical protein